MAGELVVAIVIYSMYGHIATLAEAEKRGIEAAGGKATIYQYEFTSYNSLVPNKRTNMLSLFTGSQRPSPTKSSARCMPPQSPSTQSSPSTNSQSTMPFFSVSPPVMVTSPANGRPLSTRPVASGLPVALPGNTLVSSSPLARKVVDKR